MNNNTAVVAPAPETTKALDILQIENMINGQLTLLGELKDKHRAEKSALDDTFKNDKKYRELDDAAKSAASVRSNYKKAFLKDPAVAEATARVEGLKDEIKDAKKALSDYLREYKRITHENKFETKDGQMCLIEEMYKLVVKPA